MTACQCIQSCRHDEDHLQTLKLSVTMKMTVTVVVVSETADLLGFSHQPSLSYGKGLKTRKTPASSSSQGGNTLSRSDVRRVDKLLIGRSTGTPTITCYIQGLQRSISEAWSRRATAAEERSGQLRTGSRGYTSHRLSKTGQQKLETAPGLMSLDFCWITVW